MNDCFLTNTIFCGFNFDFYFAFMKKYLFAIAAFFALIIFTSFKINFSGKSTPTDSVQYANEKHFKNIQQLTFGGDNAEAYWSYDGKYVVFQRTNPKEGINCDQIFSGKIPEKLGDPFIYHQVSKGGRTTCAYFLPDGKHIIYGSTHLDGNDCPPLPDRSKHGNKYIWPLYDSYDIFLADTSGKIIKQLTTTKGYDAEGTLSPDGKKMIFTSVRDGDIDLYVMDMKTYKVKRITNELGYDGGAWFSPDGKKIVWRASRPKTKEEIDEYKSLLKENLVAPTHMEVFVANADGTNQRQITFLEQANWAPNFTPDGKQIIFCSNHEYKYGFPFNMYLTDINGKGLEKISRDKGFDAFPMFSPDGKRILFSSNRNNGGGHDTNLFVADWVK
ncbi:protein TolB [mine drainage metagenome]|uniref:Protein TolB n=1 Tax=mine drainage metagenome TaxID=410659 RepID=A0A1J5RN72_9ZZZZ